MVFENYFHNLKISPLGITEQRSATPLKIDFELLVCFYWCQDTKDKE
jgi:hypothetical protein